MNKEYRYKILSIPFDEILSLFCSFCDCNLISKIQLPENVKVISVKENYNRLTFDFVLESPDYPCHEPGDEIGYINFDKILIRRYQVTEFKGSLA